MGDNIYKDTIERVTDESIVMHKDTIEILITLIRTKGQWCSDKQSQRIHNCRDCFPFLNDHIGTDLHRNCANITWEVTYQFAVEELGKIDTALLMEVLI